MSTGRSHLSTPSLQGLIIRCWSGTCLSARYRKGGVYPVTDHEAVEAFEYLSCTEGVIPAIESAHAVAVAMKLAQDMRRDQIIVVGLSGRGDKDVASIARYKGVDIRE